MSENKKIGQLLYKFMQGTLTEEEETFLECWKTQSHANQFVFDEVTNEENISEILKEYHPANRQILKKVIWEKVAARLPQMRKKSVVRRRGMYMRIAAVIMLTLGITGYFFWQENRKAGNSEAPRFADVKAPHANKATITLANGQKVSLDSLLSGTLAVQGDGKLVKLANGQIVYEGTAGEAAHIPIYNTLENPKGSKVIDMVFSDGSHIWLNAGSSVTFPVVFSGVQRKITLTGEAFLDVAHNAAMPFIVEARGVAIEVLGTNFNVNAYNDEEDIKVTLLKGAVKLNNQTSSGLLKPGQQACVKDKIRVSNDVDVDAVMAWKNNKFLFNNNNIQEVMRQLEKWYNIKVVYETQPTREEFVGSISRNVNLSQILALLSETKAVNFEIKGNLVVVKK